MTQIFILGASITYGVGGSDGGWADMIKRELHHRQYDKSSDGDERYEVYNFAKPSMTVEDVRKSMITDIGYRRREGAEIIILLSVGMNDAKSINSPEAYVSTSKSFSASLDNLLNDLKKITNKVIFVGYTPVNEEMTTPRVNPFTKEKTYFFNDRIREFNETSRILCEKKNIAHVDIFDKAVSSGWSDGLVDGVHPDAVGHEWIFEQLKPYLERLLA